MNLIIKIIREVKDKSIDEKNPLGTGGFIFKFNDILDDIFLLNGDTIFNVDLKKLYLNLDNSRAIIALKIKKSKVWKCYSK